MQNGPVLTLLELVQFRLYVRDEDGDLDVSSPIEVGSIERLRLHDELMEVETRPTAERHPKVHHIGEMHEITAERIWRLDGTTLKDYPLEPNVRYVLVLGWTEEEELAPVWYSRTYEGVTAKSADVEMQARQGSLQPEEEVNWRAESLRKDSGAGAYEFDASQVEPEMYVQWVKGAQSLRLFEYNSTTRVFSETRPGISTGKAVIVNTDDLQITIEGTLALQVNAGALTMEELVEAPGIAAFESPRLEFWRDGQRLGTLSKTGVLRVFNVEEAVPALGTDRFAFSGEEGLAATLGPAGLVANAITEA